MGEQGPIGIVGAAAAHLLGGGWRGLSERVRAAVGAAPSMEEPRVAPPLAAPPWTRDDVPSVAVSTEREVQDRRALRLMAQPTRLAAIVMRDALLEAGCPAERTGVGYCFAVGAGSGPMSELGAMLGQSLDEGRLSLQQFATRGLAATNPLFAFQLLNNYVHCHPAILEGLGGGARGWFSRGAGTVRAMEEAIASLREGECEQVVAGGADCAWAAGTWLELRRRGLLDAGFVPGEAAAAVTLVVTDGARSATAGAAHAVVGPRSTGRAALARGDVPVIGWLEAVRIDDAPGPSCSGTRDDPLPACPVPPVGPRCDALAEGLELDSVDVVVLAPWGPAARLALDAWVQKRTAAERLDLTAVAGDSLAATPALAATVALDAVVGSSRCALAVGLDVDDALWALLVRGAP